MIDGELLVRTLTEKPVETDSASPARLKRQQTTLPAFNPLHPPAPRSAARPYAHCKLNAVDPQAYLADVLARLVNRHPASQIDRLMPWAYARADPVA